MKLKVGLVKYSLFKSRIKTFLVILMISGRPDIPGLLSFFRSVQQPLYLKEIMSGAMYSYDKC
jgi:hypothetical protein